MDFSFPEYHPREAARQKGAGRLWVPPDSSWRTIAHLERPAWISRCRHQLICPRAIPSDSRTTLVACKHSSYKSEIDLSSPPTPSLLTVIDTIQKATLPCLLITSERTEGRCQDENGSGSWKPKTRLEVTVAISLLEKREKKDTASSVPSVIYSGSSRQNTEPMNLSPEWRTLSTMGKEPL